MGLFRQTVDSIVSDIDTKIEQLRVVAEAKAAEAEVHDAAVAERQKLAAEAREVVTRAKNIAGRFAVLIEKDL